MNNPITEEIREIRHRLAAKFNNDLDLIVADLQRQERESGRVYVDWSRAAKESEKADLQTSGADKAGS